MHWRPGGRRDRAFEAADAGAADPVVKVVDKTAPDVADHLRLQPEVEKSLLDAGMPAEGSSLYDGPKRAADTPEDAARKFVLWAQAVGAVGTHTVRTISALYWECAEVDHREPVAINRFLRALKAARCVRQGASTSDRRLWIIDPPEAPRIPKAQLADRRENRGQGFPTFTHACCSVSRPRGNIPPRSFSAHWRTMRAARVARASSAALEMCELHPELSIGSIHQIGKAPLRQRDSDAAG